MTTPRNRLARLERLEADAAAARTWESAAELLDDRGRELVDKAGADFAGLDDAELAELEAQLAELAARRRGDGGELVPA